MPACRVAQGLVTINLRGLGEGSTLVLVNGNRIAAAPAEFGTFTDVSTIPFSAIERVEVLTDGASAVYGSDAVGGVVNFILRKDYRGAESTVRYENSSSGGHRKVVEQTLGLNWDTGSLTASANFSQEDAVVVGKPPMPALTSMATTASRAEGVSPPPMASLPCS